MIPKARAGLTFLRHLLRTRDHYWAGRLAARKVPYGAARLDRASGRLHLAAASLLLGREHECLLGGYHDAAALTAAGARFSLAAGEDAGEDGAESGAEEVRAEVGGLRFLVQTAEELYILREIFVNGVYNLRAPAPVVVWDIGMNVGLASLYFASRPEVAHVVACEPFAPTYRQALRNIGLNPEAGRKITPLNFGIGGSERSVRVAYRYDIKGSVGINGLPPDARGAEGAAEERLDMRPAAAVLGEIAAAHPKRDIIAKVDCEGAEYEIIRSLADAGVLARVRAFLIEWHAQGPDDIVGHLAGAGFTTLSLLPLSPGTGMLYAVRSGGPDA